METRNRIVVKSNKVISSRIKDYSLVQTKIMNLAISELTEYSTANDVMTFYATDLLYATGLGESNHTELRRATLGMIRGIEIQDVNGAISQVPIFSKIKYHEGGTVDIQFHEEVLPYFVQAKKEFTKYYFENIQRLRSTYSIKLYELCKQYQNTRQKYRDITLKMLKVYFDIGEGKYKLYGHLKSKVIVPAIREISEKTDIIIKMEEMKKGRAVASIRFFIELKIQKDVKCIDVITPAMQKIMSDYQISKSVAVELYEMSTSEEHLLYILDVVNNRIQDQIKRNGEIRNLTKYAEKAIRNEISSVLDSKVVEKKIEKIKAINIQEKKKEQEKRKKDSKKKAAQVYLDSLSHDELSALKDKVTKEPIGRIHKKRKLNDSILQAILCQYVVENILD